MVRISWSGRHIGCRRGGGGGGGAFCMQGLNLHGAGGGGGGRGRAGFESGCDGSRGIDEYVLFVPVYVKQDVVL